MYARWRRALPIAISTLVLELLLTIQLFVTCATKVRSLPPIRSCQPLCAPRAPSTPGILLSVELATRKVFQKFKFSYSVILRFFEICRKLAKSFSLTDVTDPKSTWCRWMRRRTSRQMRTTSASTIPETWPLRPPMSTRSSASSVSSRANGMI